MDEETKKYGFNPFEVSFKKAYFSQLMHTRKPKPDGFQMIIDENDLNPAETLFIDDNSANVEAAKSLGLHTYLMPKDKKLEQLFRCNLTFAEGVVQ